MALVSSAAMWIGQHKGKLIIEWFGWEISTTPSFFTILLIIFFFILYLLIAFTIKVIKTPIIIKKKIIAARLKKAEDALHNGIIASTYGNKVEVNKSLMLAKKSIKESPLLLLLDLQDSILKKNQKKIFFYIIKYA